MKFIFYLKYWMGVLYFLPILSYCQDLELQDKLTRLSEAEQVFLYDEYAKKYRETNPKRSLEYCNKGLVLAEKVKDTSSVAYFYTFIGVLHKNMGNYEVALDFYKKAIPVNQLIKNIPGNAGIYNNIAFVYRLQGKYKNALEYYLKSLELFENEPKYARQKSNVLNNIGSLYQDQKNYKKAIEYFGESLKIAQQIKDTLGIAFAYNNTGEVYLKQGKTQEAKAFFWKSLVWKKAKNHKRSMASGYANLGLVYQKEQKLDSAEYQLGEALNLYREISDLNGEVETLLALGDIKISQNQDDKAANYYQEALKHSLGMGTKPLTQKAYKYLSEYFAKKQEYAQAYSMRVFYDNTKDSLMNLEQMKQVNEMQARYDDDSKKKQIQLLEKEKTIYSLEKASQNQLKWVLTGVLVVVVLGIIGLAWAYRLKQRSNEQLSQQNKVVEETLSQKEILLKEIHHRVKNNLQIISSLLHLQAHKGQNPQDMLQQSQDRIQAMAIIHEKLYKSDNLQSISLADYIENLLNYFEKTYALEQKNIQVQTTLENIHLDIDRLVPCGLILNELITNAIKYAFTEKHTGIISVWASLQAGVCILEIKDNGVGLPADFNPQKAKSLGLRLVDGLVKQIKGAWEYKTENGSLFQIRFEPALQVT